MGFKSVKNPYNTLFKQQVVGYLYHDIYIFSETHSLGKECVQFDNYKIYCNNRVPHANVTKGSGGIAIALHHSVVESHTMLSVVEGEDGQIEIQMYKKYLTLQESRWIIP